MKINITLFILLLLCFSADCEDKRVVLTENTELVKTIQLPDTNPRSDSSKIENHKVKPKRRLIAAFLCVTLGPFGMHRLYLGTKPRVAAAYTLTLGGGIGILPLIDLFHIVFVKDISRYKNNDKFIMWAK